MRILPTHTGGRIVQGDTPWGRFRVEWDAAGKLVAHEIEIRTPPGTAAAPPAADAGCSACKQGKGEAKTKNDLTAWHRAMRDGTGEK